jgi:dihydrolipoamide dehydrogenase
LVEFRFSASGKAKATGTQNGLQMQESVLTQRKYGEWLGCHMIGAGVTDMITSRGNCT